MDGQGSLVARSGEPSGPGAAARWPAESESQPSTGQVLVLTERTERAALEPSLRNDHSAGVALAETSVQVMPPVPMSTIGPVAEPGAGACAR